MSYKIVIDLSHNEQIEELPESFSEESDYEIAYIDKNEGPIDFSKLEDADVLFIGNIQYANGGKNVKLTPNELIDIKKFVGEGGGLFLTTGAGGDRDIAMKEGSIRVLYKVTGVKRFWNGIIYETGSNFLVKKENVLVNELFAHPITKGITELIMPNSTFFSLVEDVEDIILTSEKTEFHYYVDDDVNGVGAVPVCAVSDFFEGRSVSVGSSEFLLDDYEFGVECADNLLFLSNILQWLTFEL